MPDCVTFMTLTPWERTGEEICSLCRYRTAVLDYELESEELGFHPLQGYCCGHCAANLLAALEKLQRARLKNIDSYAFAGIDTTPN